MRSFITSAMIIALALVATACADKVTLGPGDGLVGSWINPDARFVATHTAVTWTAPCESATFAPITLDSTGAFSVESTSFVISGNIRQFPGEQLHITGRLIDGNLVISRYAVHTEIGSSDPIGLTLTPGSSNAVLVCSA